VAEPPVEPFGDDPEAALRATRERFITEFPTRCESFARLLDHAPAAPPAAERESARHLAHRMAGLAGMIGLPAVTSRARELEELLSPEAADLGGAATALDRLREAFAEDLRRPVPSWAVAAPTEGGAPRVLLVEDDPEQRMLLGAGLRQAGYPVTEVARGDEAVGAIRVTRPQLVLLDVDLPGLDGLQICRLLRTDPELHDTPIIFLTGRSSPADRVAGLAIGGDDYLLKPVDLPELRLRIGLVLRRRAAPLPLATGVLAYDAFLQAAGEQLARSSAALALVRLPQDHAAEVATTLAEEVRRRDLVGRYDERHALVLLLEATAAEAAQQLTSLADTLERRGMTIVSGVAGGTRGAAFRALLEQSDEALAAARFQRKSVALYGERSEAAAAAPLTVLVVDDDPDVARVLDSRLRAAGYRTVLAFDGQQALDAMAASPPDVVLLDLMLPRLTGFEVLAAMKQTGARRPKTVVVSARGREADVTRAFELGADDYVTKPFGPEELLARLARLLR